MTVISYLAYLASVCSLAKLRSLFTSVYTDEPYTVVSFVYTAEDKQAVKLLKVKCQVSLPDTAAELTAKSMGEKHWFAVHEYGIYQQTVIVLDTTLKCVDSICVVGVRSVKYKPCALAVEEAAKISDMTCEEDPEILKTRELLSEAQLLTRDIEELLDLCTSTGPSNQRRNRMIQQDCQASIEEDGETLVIEGFRFESAASREDLRRLSSQAGARGRQGDT